MDVAVNVIVSPRHIDGDVDVIDTSGSTSGLTVTVTGAIAKHPDGDVALM